MPQLRIDQLTAGMVVDQDVKDRSGRMLLRSGSVLNERSLRVLQTWGIIQISVEGEGDEGEDDSPRSLEEADPALLAEARNRADELFRHVDRGHPAAAILVKLTTLRLLQELHREGTR